MDKKDYMNELRQVRQRTREKEEQLAIKLAEDYAKMVLTAFTNQCQNNPDRVLMNNHFVYSINGIDFQEETCNVSEYCCFSKSFSTDEEPKTYANSYIIIKLIEELEKIGFEVVYKVEDGNGVIYPWFSIEDTAEESS